MSKENERLNEVGNWTLNTDNVSKSSTPHRCPVCNGKGLVHSGFYMQPSEQRTTISITPETCRSCSGSGIVWC